MANTRRETTVFRRAGEESLLGLCGERSKHNSANLLARQAGSPASASHFEAIVPLIAKLARAAVGALDTDPSGSTVSVSNGNLRGFPCFAVSVYAERTVELTVLPNWELIFAFGVINADLLLQPNHALGIWFDKGRKRHVLDVVICPSLLDDAIRLGIQHGQRCIYDLSEGREITLVPHLDISAVHTNHGEK
jgi:hypothetical protein